MFTPPFAEPLSDLLNRLTPDQREAYDHVRRVLPPLKFSFGFDVLGRNEPTFALLTGYAGAGKTFLLYVLARAARLDGASVCLAAPTHKAVAVLADKVPGFPLFTVAKLTGKTASGHDDAGDRTFARAETGGTGGLYNYIVVDEASMLDEQTILDILNSVAQGGSVLFVGDPAQLPPVMPGADDTTAISPIFGIMGGETHRHLDGIVRQARDNPLIEAAGRVRRMIETGQFSNDWQDAGWRADVGGIALMSNKEAEAAAKAAFLSDEFRDNPNSYRVVAYTNAACLEWNWRIRDWLFPDKDINVPFYAGELAVVNEAYAPKDEILLQNNEEVRILEARHDPQFVHFPEHRHAVTGAVMCKAWTHVLDGYRVRVSGGQYGKPAEGFVPTHFHQWKSLDIQLRVEARACQGQKHTRGYERFRFNAGILHLRHNYALTVHKAQGSTFDNVLLPYRDLAKARRTPADTAYFGRLLYTAITRARKTVGVAQ